MARLISLPCGVRAAMVLVLVLSTAPLSSSRPTAQETEWTLSDGDWVVDETRSDKGLHITSSAAVSGQVGSYPSDCGVCNASACPGGVQEPEKCNGRFQWDECHCCKICVKADGQRCQTRRRPCDTDLECLPAEHGIRRCQRVEGNCSVANQQRAHFKKSFPLCRRCYCNGDGQEVCRPNGCRPPMDPDLPANCVRQRCRELSVLGACCSDYYDCRCIKTQDVATSPTPLPTPSVCLAAPSCPSNRTSGKSLSSLRYTYSARQRRCVMHWRTAKCTDDRNFASLDECRSRCVPGAWAALRSTKTDKCQIQTGITGKACSRMGPHHHRALYRAMVHRMEQTAMGVLYTLEIKHVYLGPCRHRSTVHLLVYGGGRQSDVRTVCPHMEPGYKYLVGYPMSGNDTTCGGIEAVTLDGGEVVHAEVMHTTQRHALAVPWNQANTRPLAQACVAAATRQSERHRSAATNPTR